MLRQRLRLLQALAQGIHIGDAHQLQLLGRQPPQGLQLPGLADLMLAAKQQRVIVIHAEHPVERNLAAGVQDMDIIPNAFGAFPLVDLQARRRGEQHIRPEHIQHGKGLVPFPDEAAFYMLKLPLQRRIVGRGCEVMQLLSPGLELLADRAKHIPVALVIRKDGIGHALLFFPDGVPAAEEKAQLYRCLPGSIKPGAKNAHQNGEQHTPGAGVNIGNERRMDHKTVSGFLVFGFIHAIIIPPPFFVNSEQPIAFRAKGSGRKAAAALPGLPMPKPPLPAGSASPPAVSASGSDSPGPLPRTSRRRGARRRPGGR